VELLTSKGSHLTPRYDITININKENAVAKLDKIIQQMLTAPQNVRFSDLAHVCEHFFGAPRQEGTSHKVFKTPWAGDPRVNIQNKNGMAKPYQVKQVLAAIEKLQRGNR
jgi:hypothetical protein